MQGAFTLGATLLNIRWRFIQTPDLNRIPPFKFKVRKTFKDCLSRQISEAVAIMMTGDNILNGKCEYLRNCIARVKVEEDDIERKKREMFEESEEKERIESIEKFRKEKEPGLLRIKRKRESQVNNQQEYYLKKPRMMQAYNDEDEDYVNVCEGILDPTIRKDIMESKDGNSNKSSKTKTVCSDNQLALEYFPAAEKNERILALEYYPEGANILTGNKRIGGEIKDAPSSASSTTSPHNKKLSMKPCSNNYILKLTEWKAWWTMVTRLNRRAEKSLSEEEMLRSARVKSENEKMKFVKKFYFEKPQNLTKPTNITTRPDERCAQIMEVPMPKSDAQPTLNGSLTPGKRNREFINIFGGEIESPAKRQKFDSKNIWNIFKSLGEGSNQLPIQGTFSRARTPSELADVTLPADPDLA